MLLIAECQSDVYKAGFRLYPSFHKDGPRDCSAQECRCYSFTSSFAAHCRLETLPACFVSGSMGSFPSGAKKHHAHYLEGWCRNSSFLPVPLSILVCVWTQQINLWSILLGQTLIFESIFPNTTVRKYICMHVTHIYNVQSRVPMTHMCVHTIVIEKAQNFW